MRLLPIKTSNTMYKKPFDITKDKDVTTVMGDFKAKVGKGQMEDINYRRVWNRSKE